MAEIMRLARIVSNFNIAEQTFRMVLECPEIARQAKAAQFITLPPLDETTTWRRPLTVHEVRGDMLIVIYRVVGRNTRLYSRLRDGEQISVVGPCGRPVALDPGVKLFWLVAGGVGLAPLLYIGRTIADFTSAMMKFVAGFPTKAHIFGVAEFEHWIGQGNMKLATDDGSHGFSGYAPDLFSDALKANLDQGELLPQEMAVFTCGPKPMMKAVAQVSQEFGLRCFALLEARMACGGLDACKGCVVKTTSGLKQVCKDGPVFDAAEVIWDE